MLLANSLYRVTDTIYLCYYREQCLSSQELKLVKMFVNTPSLVESEKYKELSTRRRHTDMPDRLDEVTTKNPKREDE